MEEYKNFTIESDVTDTPHNFTVMLHSKKYKIKNKVFGRASMARLWVDAFREGVEFQKNKTTNKNQKK